MRKNLFWVPLGALVLSVVCFILGLWFNTTSWAWGFLGLGAFLFWCLYRHTGGGAWFLRWLASKGPAVRSGAGAIASRTPGTIWVTIVWLWRNILSVWLVVSVATAIWVWTFSNAWSFLTNGIFWFAVASAIVAMITVFEGWPRVGGLFYLAGELLLKFIFGGTPVGIIVLGIVSFLLGATLHSFGFLDWGLLLGIPGILAVVIGTFMTLPPSRTKTKEVFTNRRRGGRNRRGGRQRA